MHMPGSRLMFAAAVLGCASLLHAQTTPAQAPDAQQPCTTSPQPQPCSTASPKPADKGSTTDRFPFPGDTPAPAPPAGDAPKTAAPSAQPGTDRFPFPGEQPAAAPQPASPGSSSSSSGEPPAFPSDDTNTPDPSDPNAKPAAPEGRRLLKRVNPVGTKLLTPDEREAEDLSVARFYIDQGNLKGAYLRTQDAVKVLPADPDAHCALAEAALKLNKRDEAVAEFTTCLKLDPVEKEAKNAKRELARLK